MRVPPRITHALPGKNHSSNRRFRWHNSLQLDCGWPNFPAISHKLSWLCQYHKLPQLLRLSSRLDLRKLLVNVPSIRDESTFRGGLAPERPPRCESMTKPILCSSSRYQAGNGSQISGMENQPVIAKDNTRILTSQRWLNCVIEGWQRIPWLIEEEDFWC